MRSAGDIGTHNGPKNPLASKTFGFECHTRYRGTDPCCERISASVRVAAASGRDLPSSNSRSGGDSQQSREGGLRLREQKTYPCRPRPLGSFALRGSITSRSLKTAKLLGLQVMIEFTPCRKSAAASSVSAIRLRLIL